MQDIHCVASLGKLYFRELPNPLLTYQLYDKFAVSTACSRTRFTAEFHVLITMITMAASYNR